MLQYVAKTLQLCLVHQLTIRRHSLELWKMYALTTVEGFIQTFWHQPAMIDLELNLLGSTALPLMDQLLLETTVASQLEIF